MKSKALIVFLIGAAILLWLSIFTVDEREQALMLQFGRIVRTDIPPGLHFKLPLIQDVLKFDGRIQTLDTPPQRYLTSEKKNVNVDSFAKWRINNVAEFYKRTTGTSRGRLNVANRRLGDVILKQLRDEFGQRTIQQVVSGERAEIMEKLRTAAKDQADKLGLELIDVRMKRVDLPSDVSQSVYNRMSAERKEVAKRLRSEGEETARRLRAEADREHEVLLAYAERDAQQLRGEGDAIATDTYAKAFSQDHDFYSLYRSLTAYRNSFNSTADVLLLEPKTQFFRYFHGSYGSDKRN